MTKRALLLTRVCFRVSSILVVSMFAAALFVIPGPARADTVLYDQPASFPSGNACSCRTSALDSGGNGFVVWDDFSLSTNASITSATWQGFYFLDVAPDGTILPPGNGIPNTNTWGILFYADNNGAPGSFLNADYVPASSVTITPAGLYTGLPSACGPEGCIVYNFSVTGLPVFAAIGGTTYWINIQSFQTDLTSAFAWTLGTGDPTGRSFQCHYSSGTADSCEFTLHDGDVRAFALDGTPTPVPEPASLLLVGTGILGLGGTFRKKLPGTERR